MVFKHNEKIVLRTEKYAVIGKITVDFIDFV